MSTTRARPSYLKAPTKKLYGVNVYLDNGDTVFVSPSWYIPRRGEHFPFEELYDQEPGMKGSVVIGREFVLA